MKSVEPILMLPFNDPNGKLESEMLRLVSDRVDRVVSEVVDVMVWEATQHINDIRRHYGER